MTILRREDIPAYLYDNTFFLKKLLYLFEIDLAPHYKDARCKLA